MLLELAWDCHSRSPVSHCVAEYKIGVNATRIRQECHKLSMRLDSTVRFNSMLMYVDGSNLVQFQQ